MEIVNEQTKKKVTIEDFDDAKLGAMVRKEAIRFMEENRGTASYAYSAGLALVMLAADVNSTLTTLEMNGVTRGNEKLGDYEIQIIKK